MNTFWQHKSVINSDEFFLAQHGESDPYRELLATVKAMARPPTTLDTHIRCRFPARTRWIEQQLNSKKAFNVNKHCPAYTAWKAENKAESISIIFASGYLGNPASFYGHTFIKFNTDNSRRSSDLTNTTLSYGAINTKNDNIAVYVAKALVGGYQAAFRKISFYNQEQLYNENENRDLWDYQLNLSKEEVDFVIDHAWETIDKEYTYYFFKENCAFRMVELIEIIPQINITQNITAYAIPQSVIQRLNNQEIRGEPLLISRRFYPSRQTKLYDRYHRLNDEEKFIFKDMVNHQVSPQHAAYAQLSTPSKLRILDTIIDYYGYITDAKDKQTRTRHPNYLKALAMRFSLPASKPSTITPANPPELGRPPSWMQLSSYIQHANARLLRIRPAYYDQLDSNPSHVKNSALSMFDTELLFFDNKIKIKKLDLVKIEAAKPGLTGLSGDNSQAWKAKFGIEQYRIGCFECLVPRLQGDYGYGKTMNEHLYAAAYIGGGIERNHFIDNYVFARASLDIIYRPTNSMGLILNYTKHYNLNHQHASDIFKTEIRWSPHSLFDLRLRYEADTAYKDARTLSLGIGTYF